MLCHLAVHRSDRTLRYETCVALPYDLVERGHPESMTAVMPDVIFSFLFFSHSGSLQTGAIDSSMRHLLDASSPRSHESASPSVSMFVETLIRDLIPDPMDHITMMEIIAQTIIHV